MKIALRYSACLLLLISSWTNAQKLRFDNYSLAHGLSQSTIVSMLQDRQGFIWIGTEDGLNRFDGYTFKIYRKSKADSLNTIGGNFVWDMLEAKNGHLWIAHEGGISRFDPVHQHFKVYTIGHGAVTVKSLHQTDTAGLWIGTADQGLFYLDLATEKITQYINTRASLLPHNNILDIISYDQNNLLIATRGAGIFLFNPRESFRRAPLKKPQDSTLLVRNDVWKMVRHNEHYWLGTLHGLLELDKNLQLIQHYPLNHGTIAEQRISTMLFDKKESLWVACYGGGLARVNTKTATYQFSNHSPTDPGTLANDLVFSLLLDRSENLWVGTWIAGVSKLRKGFDNFANYSNDDIGTPSDFITSVTSLPCDKKETLLLGVYGGGIRTASLERGKPLNFSAYHVTQEALDRAIEPLNCFYQGKENLWVGSDTDGLIGIPIRNIACGTKPASIVHYTGGAEPQNLSGNTVKTVVEDHQGTLWVGTIANGLNKIASSGNTMPPTITRYTKNENDPTSLRHNRINHILQDRDKNIWVATSNGLSLYTDKGFKHFLSGKIITMLQSNTGRLYVGSENGLFENNPKQPFVFTHVAALGDQLINAIRQDHSGKVWITTNQGMFRYDPTTFTAIQFRSSDGLQSDEYNFNAAAKTRDGLLAFGGVNGLTLFDPERLQLNTQSPPVVVTSLRIANREVPVKVSDNTNEYALAQDIRYTQKLTLRHDQNYLTFNFTALDFTNPTKNKYAYTLEGLDNEWVQADARNRSVTYTNLAPGTYTLRIKGTNNDNVWNEQGSSLVITIQPPWWQTWWAYILYALAVGIALVVSRRNLIQRERLKTQLQMEHLEVTKLKELDDFKSRFFANISHEFRTPLSLIIGPTEKLLAEEGKSRPELNIIHNNSLSLLNLVNQMLDLSLVEAGSLQLQVRRTDLTTGLKIFTSPFYSLAASKRIELSITVPSTPIDGYADLSFLEKIINNLLSNAVKYTQAGGTIAFRAEDKNGYLLITVTDTGMGIPDNQGDKVFDRFYQVHDVTSVEGTGLGLALTRELVKAHKGEITVTSEWGKGSTFIVTLPIAEQYYRAEEHRNEALGYVPAKDQPARDTTPQILVDINNTASDGSDKPVLLVIEDNPELREFIKSTLVEVYTVLEAADGETGLRIAIDNVPDIIITDWMMPRMDGATVCRNIKSTTATDHIPIILLTAKAGVESRIEGLETGADDYLTKPFDLRELRIRVANLIDQRKKLQAKYQSGVPLTYKPVKAESANDKFLKRLQEVVEERMSDSKFGVEEMAREIGMSRVQLYRKLTALTSQSAVEYLRSYRLERAADLLRRGAGNIAEIAFQVGFDNPSYFTKTFREHFGKLPSDLVKS